jgi:dGTPase
MLEEQEARTLHPRAARSAESRGRDEPEPQDDERPVYQRDRDRLLFCKSFRRLAGKTQVFLAPRGDHYRNRLTHTLEVAQVGRSIARALRLNEMLVEAMVMGHDLGHTPFGHAGERVLAETVSGGFHHVLQSVRVVEVLERGNVLMQGSGTKAMTLEAEVVRLADVIAYVNHDLDDAVRAGLLTDADLPAEVRRTLGERHSQRLSTLIGDAIANSDPDRADHIELSPPVHAALLALREFLYARVYENPEVHEEFVKAQRILRDLLAWCLEDAARLEARHGVAVRPGETLERAATDFLSGMTDRFALATWESIFVPRPWSIV